MAGIPSHHHLPNTVSPMVREERAMKGEISGTRGSQLMSPHHFLPATIQALGRQGRRTVAMVEAPVVLGRMEDTIHLIRRFRPAAVAELVHSLPLIGRLLRLLKLLRMNHRTRSRSSRLPLVPEVGDFRPARRRRRQLFSSVSSKAFQHSRKTKCLEIPSRILLSSKGTGGGRNNSSSHLSSSTTRIHSWALYCPLIPGQLVGEQAPHLGPITIRLRRR